MARRMWGVIAIAAALALGAGVGIGAAVWAEDDHGSTGPGMGAPSDAHGMGAAPGAPMDQREFMRMMVPHHQSATEMAEIAVDRAERNEVRNLAREIVAAQQDEIERMRAWHREWFGEELVPSESAPHGSVEMHELRSADDFDRVFLRMMIPHHASAIVMAESVMMGGAREEIDRMASEIIAAQASEIGQMQRWRAEWYPPHG